ncbi:Lysophospholipid acyltransferase [Apiospora rasikravindrae]|uniref:Lysophospholipid acyltransferase n=1 Tax=Apiospora rasikravindrae TaxID=990691 RepID=A0ABR1SKE9_9PEZI
MLPYINKPFEALSGVVGASPDELKLIFSFLLSYPLAGILKRVPDARPAYKNIYSISVCIFYLVGLFDLWDGLWHILLSAAVTYALAYFLRGSPYMPWMGFVFLMGHTAVNQLRRQFANNPADVDITGAQMVMVMKLSAFCWNVADGTLPEDQLSDFQKDRKIVELPSLLDYAGFVLFFPSFMAGPPFDYNEYKRWVDCTMFDVPTNVDPAKRPPTRKKRKIPRSATPAMWKAAGGLLWIGAFVKFSAWFDWKFILADGFMSYSIVHRIFYLHMVGVTARLKYYGVWSLTEGACILSGLGYKGIDPKTGRVSWDRLQNINPWGVESAQNSRAYLENWNMGTNKWLRYYIYLRVTPRNKKPGFRASLATFTTSAFWHGFYPGYYLTFVLASFVQTAAKNARRYLRPFFLDPVSQNPLPSKRYYDIASYLATQLVFCFVTAPFVILRFDDSIKVWSRVYFYAAFITFSSFAFFHSPGKQWLRAKLERRTRDAGVKMARSVSSDSLNSTSGGGREKRPPLVGPGLSEDMTKETNEAFEEIRAEIKRRQSQSSGSGKKTLPALAEKTKKNL